MRRYLTDRQLSQIKLGPEDLEQMTFVEWLEIKGYTYTAIPNSTYTKSWKQKARNDLLGLRSGFPDLAIIADGHFCAVEMKEPKGGNGGTKAQREWVEALQQAGIPAKICKGADEAIAFVQSVLSGQ